jgi:DNA-nicking Smr family endonuclease
MPEQTNKNDFIAEMSDVKPIQQDKVFEPKSAESPSRNYRRKAASSFGLKYNNFLTDGEVDQVEPEAVLSFKMDGVQPAVFKKLRLGRYDYDYHLDLHRKTVAEAREDVYNLLRSSSKFNYRSLLITHGKGIMSKPPARLKSYINHWLKQVDTVIAFHSALPKHGGTGSVYVLLKKVLPENVINPGKYD